MRKIEVPEDDLKKVILILKLSRPYLNIPPKNLALINWWRVSDKLANKLMKKAGLIMVTNKGRTTLKQTALDVSENSTAEPPSKIPRCRKSKLK